MDGVMDWMTDEEFMKWRLALKELENQMQFIVYIFYIETRSYERTKVLRYPCTYP